MSALRAYCWRDDFPAVDQPSAPPSAVLPAFVPIRWARHPWPSNIGPLVAIRLVLGEVQVGVRVGGQLEWMAADKMLKPREAQRWASFGF